MHFTVSSWRRTHVCQRPVATSRTLMVSTQRFGVVLPALPVEIFRVILIGNGRSTVGKCTGPKWSKWSNDHFGQNDLIPNWICEPFFPLQHSKTPRTPNLIKICPDDCFSGFQLGEPKFVKNCRKFVRKLSFFNLSTNF